MSKKTDREQEQAHAVFRLRRALKSAQSGLWVRAEYGRGATNYMHLYVITPRAGRIEDVTYYAARAAGDFTSVERGWKLDGSCEDAAGAAYRAAGLPYSPLESYAEFR